MPKNLSFGFTLVELLVVIAIIAILSTLGLAIYGQAQAKARDAKRISDINAIADALEINKSKSGYNKEYDTAFKSGRVPYDPTATFDPAVVASRYGRANTCGGSGSDTYMNKCWYCKNNNNSSTVKTAEARCNVNDWLVGDPNWGTGVVTSWIVCANLEKEAPYYYCRKSTQ